MKGTSFSLNEEFQISGEFIASYMEEPTNAEAEDLTYDITFQAPSDKKDKEFYFDIETRYDFFTTNVEVTLFAENGQNKDEWINLGDAVWVDLFNDENNELYEYGQKSAVKRLKVDSIKDDLQQDQSLSGTYIIRLRFSKTMVTLLKQLKLEHSLPSNDEVCFTFDLSIVVTQPEYEEDDYEAYTDEDENELIRIEWATSTREGQEQLFDPREKLTVFLQFKETMKDIYKQIKFMPFAYMLPTNSTATDIQHQNERIYPISTRLSPVDKSIVTIQFQHGVLKHGDCYTLYLEDKLLHAKVDMSILKNSTQVCTTNCKCNPKGQASCEEDKGICHCHHPFAGPECYACIEGFTFDEQNQECQPTSKCVENGGTVDCNGHGTCFEDEDSGLARCDCDLGFEDDGLDFCAKCADPLFEYPNCYARNWIIAQSDYNCHMLQSVMPKYLYHNSTVKQSQIYQNEEGQGFWSQVYNLKGAKLKKKSTHYFKVQQNSVFRLFLDTHKSGVKVKFAIFDGEKTQIFSSDKDPITNDIVLLKFSQTEEGHSPIYTLELEYIYDKSINESSVQCPILEIQLLIQPFAKMQNYLRCTDLELKSAGEKKQFKWIFDSDSFFFNEKFTISSDMTSESPGSYIAQENAMFKIIRYEIEVRQSGNALSLMSIYNFESMGLGMTLTDKATGNVIATESYSSLEDVQQDLREQDDSLFNLENDMISYVELPSIDAGHYTLDILVAKFLFMPTKKFKTCLNFDLYLEYVYRTVQDTSDNSLYTENEYEVVSVMPAMLNGLKQTSKSKIDVRVQKPLDLDGIMSDYNGMHHLCYLENKADAHNVINPYKVLHSPEGDALSLYFHFKDAAVVPKEQLCYRLKCTSQFTLGHEVFKQPLVVATNYCYKEPHGEKGKDNITSKSEVKCNPNALPKVENDKCICTYPYKGMECEDCERGYKQEKEADTKHSVCVLDESKCSQDICNGHGQCYDKDRDHLACKCEDAYSGQYCEMCRDPTFAYPDCDSLTPADIYDEKEERDYLKRRQYNQDGYQKAKLDKDLIQEELEKPQCKVANYPKNIDRIEFMGFLRGEFHIADYYTVNHDQDNFIKFRPRHAGATLKIFLQQPALEQQKVNDDSFDIEIAIFDAENDKFLASSMNKYLDFKLKEGASINGKADFAELVWKVPYQYVDHPQLYILFRAVNFTSTNAEELGSSTEWPECENLYIEIEYREKERPCQYNGEILQSGLGQIIQVDPSTPHSTPEGKGFFSIQNNQKTFFYYQDFYLGSRGSAIDESDYELRVVIQQKFSETNMIDTVIEMLQPDIEYSDIRQPSQHPKSPECVHLCNVGSEKSYNQVQNVLRVSAHSLVRVWLTQSLLDGTCANYQLQISAQAVGLNSIEAQTLNDQQLLQCQELDMPSSLNIDRYLGSSGSSQQQSFHYLERFRVDNLKNNSAHRINFDLKEPTMVRFVATVHKHIEFDLELRELFEDQFGNRKSRKLIDSGAKGFEDSIFAQLDKGQYFLKLLFMSEEFYLAQPCQSIQLELAFSPLSDVKLLVSRTGKNQKEKLIDLEHLLENFSEGPQEVYRTATVQTYNINDPTALTNYQSYVELLSQRFTIPSAVAGSDFGGTGNSLGLVIQIESEFLLNDVNFALTNLATNKIYENQRTPHGNKLILQSIGSTGGDFELLVYAHQSLTNIKDVSRAIQSMDVVFRIDAHLIRWVVEDDFVQHHVMLNLMTQSKQMKETQVPVETVDKSVFFCLNQFEPLPQELKGHSTGQISLEGVYIIPTATISEYEHTIVFTAEEDSIRIVLERANTKLTLFTGASPSQDSQVIFESISTNGGYQQLLLAHGVLHPGSKYSIFMEFSPDENFKELEEQVCDSFRMQIHSSQANTHCLAESLFSKAASQPEETLKFSDKAEDHSLTLPMKSQTYQQKVWVSENGTSITVTFDYTHLFYVPTVKLSKPTGTNQHQQKGKDSVSAATKKQLTKDIKPTEIDLSITNMIVYKFEDLKADAYVLSIQQISKPKGCFNLVPVSLRSYRRDEAAITGDHVTQFGGSIITYLAQEEIIALNRFSEKLPISLDSYKYLKDEQYLLASEYFELNGDHPNENKITFSIDKDNTLFKVYCESSELFMTLKDRTQGKTLVSSQVRVLASKLSKGGKYELIFEYSTQKAKLKAYQFKNSFHLTLMVADQEFFVNKYVQAQGDALINCDSNMNFPLALNQAHEEKWSAHDLVYDYPVVRLSSKALTSNVVLDNYAFRINETSRFEFAVGMHSLANQVILRLSELRDYGNTIFGKQEFNLNTLDTVVGPGDYNLVIEQPLIMHWSLKGYEANSTSKESKNFDNVCGLFSFLGRITPLSEMGEQTGSFSQQKCQVFEVLPTKIYKSEADTKGGNEYFINDEGSFSHSFSELLIKKSRQTSLRAEYDRVQVAALEDAILALQLQYTAVGNHMRVSMRDALTFTEGVYHPFASNEGDAGNGIKEMSYLFKLQKGKQYFLVIEYLGEVQLDASGESELCEYYNAHLSIDTEAKMLNELQCVEEKDVKQSGLKIHNLLRDLPQRISDRDFKEIDSIDSEYRFNGYTVLSYPNDYSQESNSIDKQLIMKAIDVEINEAEFSLDTEVKFDFPYSMVELYLIEYFKQDSGSSEDDLILEDAAVQLPVEVESGDQFVPTLVRDLRVKDLKPKKEYQLVISDMLSQPLMEYLYGKSANKHPLCVYSEVNIQLTKKLSQRKASNAAPMIMSISAGTMKGGNKTHPVKLSSGKKEISITLEFSVPPFMKDSPNQPHSNHGRATRAELSSLVQLEFIHPESQKLEYKKKPVRIDVDKQTNTTVTFTYNIEEEEQGDLHFLLQISIDLPHMIDSKGRGFQIHHDSGSGEGDQMLTFLVEKRQSEQGKQQEAEKPSSEKDKIVQDITQKEEQKKDVKDQTVKCLCVHGTCLKGEKYCNRCDQGWKGKLCDIASGQQPNNINNPKGEERLGKVTVHKEGRMQRRHSVDEDDSRKSQREDSSSSRVRYRDQDQSQASFNSDHYPQTSKHDETQSLITKQHETAESQGFFSWLATSLYHLIILALTFGVIGVVAYLLLYLMKSPRIKEYLPVPLSERDDDDANAPGAMELSELRHPDTHQQQQPRTSSPPTGDAFSPDQPQRQLQANQLSTAQNQQQPQYYSQQEEDEDEDETRRLTHELHLYAFAPENDQDRQLQQQPYYQSQAFQQQQQDQYFYEDQKQPQQQHEEATSHEIDDVLKEMNEELDYNEGEEDQHFV